MGDIKWIHKITYKKDVNKYGGILKVLMERLGYVFLWVLFLRALLCFMYFVMILAAVYVVFPDFLPVVVYILVHFEVECGEVLVVWTLVFLIWFLCLILFRMWFGMGLSFLFTMPIIGMDFLSTVTIIW